MKNSRFFARLFLLATLCIGSPSLHSQSVIPIPQEVEQAEGSFTLNANTRLSCNLQGDELEQLLDYTTAPERMPEERPQHPGRTGRHRPAEAGQRRHPHTGKL